MSFGNTSAEEQLSGTNTSQRTNSSAKLEVYVSSVCAQGFYWPIHAPLILILISILVANCVVIVLTIWKETLRTVSNMILFSLSLSDLLFGLIGIPVFVSCTVTTSLLQCTLSVFLVRFTAVSSVFHLFIIACDRYVIILHSMKYPSIVTKTRATCVILLIWFVALASSSIQFAWYKWNNDLQEPKEDTIQIDKVYLLLLITVFFFLPLLVMFYIYSRIFLISFRHIFAFRRRRKNLDQPVPSMAYDLRGTFILVFMMLIFIGCWLPFFLLILQDHIPERFYYILPGWGLCVILYLRFIPPLANPILCAFCKQDYRRAWRGLTRQQPWLSLNIRIFNFPSVSRTREHRTSTSITLTEKASNNGNSLTGSVNMLAMEAY
ncbi:histamine H2 receptor-like [Stylophora pistillata]|uniref:histamine H2 receptor-like n=1 Tax=Stylophora pistillata TaxID=50429 RepID=UPI000C044DA9|nr:histamine H2 receptor-like [Stylophora pistillata]